MRLNLPVTDRERTVPDGQEIVSTTDLKGRITYANRTFIEIAGFGEDELLGKAHNIVRHPDMPPQAFEILWQTLKSGRPWMGIVKNRCKNGDYYWVDAFVAPVLENAQVVGYESVRVRPREEWKKRAGRLYRRIREGKFRQPRRLPLADRLALGFTALLLPLAAAAQWGSSLWFWGVLAAVAAMAWGLCRCLLAPLARTVAWSRRFSDDPVARLVYTGRDDEAGQLQAALLSMEARIRTMRGRFEDMAQKMATTAKRNHAASANTSQVLGQHRESTEALARAIEELNQTIHGIAANAAQAAEVTEEANRAVLEGVGFSRETAQAITELADEVERAAAVIRRVEKESSDIGMVVGVIRDIADQTNLLALNAAIEAARAGEQGRGFAVVAEEVRKLASSTQSSTHQIQQLVENLQVGTREAVGVMETGRRRAQRSVARAESAGATLTRVTENITIIKDMNLQVAGAVEQQSCVTDGIRRSVDHISETAGQVARDAESTTSTSQDLLQLATELRDITQRFAV